MKGKGKQPPQWVKSFLSHFLDARLLEGSLGDLEQKYSLNIEKGMPAWRANLLYVFEAVGFIRMASAKKDEPSTSFGQLVHTLVFFGRLVKKEKGYYVVSMFGLALSLTSFLFIAMFVVDELSYDLYHDKRDRIFRVTTHVKVSDAGFDLATTQFPAAPALKSEFPEIEEAIRLFREDRELTVGEKKFEESVIYADADFFKVFSFPLIYGDRGTALSNPGNIIFTRKASIKYFGTENSIGQVLKVNNATVKVAGVMEDIDDHSHFKFEVMIPLSAQLNAWKSERGLEGRENKWFWVGAHTYLLLREPGDEIKLNEKMHGFIKKYFPPRLQNSHYELQKLTDIHLTSHKDNEFEPNGDILYVRLFSALAVVIMLVSSINLINLSYFKMTGRIREIGIRKFLGQNAGKVVFQLTFESLLAGIISFIIALILCQAFISQFNLIVDKHLNLLTSTNIKLVGATLILVILVSIMAIARPATRFGSRPANLLLLHDYRSARSASQFRNMLIGLQVGLSFVLLVFSFIVASQVDFFKTKDLGFDKSNVVVIDLNEDFDHEVFSNEMKKHSSVVNATRADPPGKGYSGWRFVPEGGSYEKPVMLPFTSSDEDFLQTMKIKLLAGRDFTKPTDHDSIWPFLINKRAAIELGWTDDAIGRRLEVFQPGREEIMGNGEVIGIIDDYHSESLHDPIKPVVISLPSYGYRLMVRVHDVSPETIESLEATWKKFSRKPFRYSILDEQISILYSNEEKLGDLMLFFTLIALYLTCYGMFAMSSLLFSSKLKEVAIRKVFGAGEASIMRQFYGRYALFNIIAIIVGLPVAVWIGRLWLETFPYRIELSFFFFLKAGLLIMIAGVLSVSYYLAKVSWTNPLSLLRRD